MLEALPGSIVYLHVAVEADPEAFEAHPEAVEAHPKVLKA